jgi:hypothetical protein
MSPGKIVITETVSTTAPGDLSWFTSPAMLQCSTGDCGNNDDIDHPYSTRPDDGCSVVRNSSVFNVGPNEGDWSKSFVSDDGNAVSYKVTTIHHSISPFGSNNSGRVTFSISFKEQCPVTTTTSNPQDVSLSWGDSKDYPYPAGTWVVTFDSFDGHHFELRESGSAGEFLTVSGAISHVQLSLASPATLVWP